MKVPRHTIARALAARSLGLTTASDFESFGKEIAAYLLANRRTGELDSLMRDMSQYRADAGIVEVLARSASPITQDTNSSISREVRQLYPAATQIIVSHKQDDTVVAGVKLEFANQQLDLTVRTKLNHMKQLIFSRKEIQHVTRKES